jgi:hypothetical protein
MGLGLRRRKQYKAEDNCVVNLLKPSCFFTYHQIYNIQKFYMVFALRWVFCTDLRTAAFAVYIVNWLVFIGVVESAYSAVRTDSLYTEDYDSSLRGFIFVITKYY